MKRLVPLFLALTLTIGCTAGNMARDQAYDIRQGMTEQEVVQKVGKPYDINRTRTRYGVREQWVYNTRDLTYDRIYIYFEDGRVTAVQS